MHRNDRTTAGEDLALPVTSCHVPKCDRTISDRRSYRPRSVVQLRRYRQMRPCCMGSREHTRGTLVADVNPNRSVEREK
jgi:hypothetical protein